MPRLPESALRLYLVFGPQDLAADQSALDLLEEAVAGGVTCIQWRDKSEIAQAPLPRRQEAVEPLYQRAKALKVPFLVNDDVELAQALRADGVHLGQDDMDPSLARQLLGADAIIGWSVGTAVERARLDDLLIEGPHVIDYIGVGPAFPTGTKSDAGDALGATGIAAIIDGISLPAVAIGGINEKNCALL
ncbi:MAG: thiamine phosphate synthase, partial [Alphaproteobacteria bacterium]